MSAEHLLGVDIGTYSAKGVLVDVAGRVIANHVVPHRLEMPQPGWAEHDANQVWWGGFVAICRSLLEKSRVVPHQIASVGVSSISTSVLPVDAQGDPLRPAILYGIDARAAGEIAQLEQAIGREILFQRYGVQLSAQSGAPKILWLRNHEPDLWARTRMILNGVGYIVHKLTGAAVLDVYDAVGYAPLFDPARRAWNPDMAALIAPEEMLPRIGWTCEVAGRVTAAGAQASGLAAGTPVIIGTADAAAEAISAGLSQVGDLMLMVGSSTFFILKTGARIASRRFWGCDFLEPDAYALAGGAATAGSVTRWFRDQFAPLELAKEEAQTGIAYSELAALAGSSVVGAHGLVALPYFAGERTPIHDPAARGVIFGLTMRHSRGDVYRALLEGVGYSIRHNLEAMAEEGAVVRRILAVGGGTLNPLWMQMISDIADVELHIPAEQIGAAYGDAFLAGVGIGVFKDTTEATQWVNVGRIVRPDQAAHATYNGFYGIYRDLYRQTAGLMEKIGRLDMGGSVPRF